MNVSAARVKAIALDAVEFALEVVVALLVAFLATVAGVDPSVLTAYGFALVAVIPVMAGLAYYDGDDPRETVRDGLEMYVILTVATLPAGVTAWIGYRSTHWVAEASPAIGILVSGVLLFLAMRKDPDLGEFLGWFA